MRAGGPMKSKAVQYLLTALAAIFLSSLAMDAHCADVVKPAALYLSLSAADLGSTHYAMQNGAAEGNAFVRDGALAKQLAVSAAFTAADVHLQKKGHHRKLRIIVAVFRVGAVAINLHNARRER